MTRVRWIGWGAVWMAAVLLVFAPGAAAAPSPARDPACGAPDVLARSGAEAQATKIYVRLLRRKPGLGCAEDGLTKLNAPKRPAEACTAADIQFDAGALRAAEASYLALGADSKCAQTGVAAIREVERFCATGKSYDELHRAADALKAYQSALAKNPEASCATAGVADTGPSAVSRFLDDVVDLIPQVLIAIGLALVALFLALMFGHWRRVRPAFLQVPLLAHLLAPQLTLETIDDRSGETKAGPAMTARITQQLQRLQKEAIDTTGPVSALDSASPNEAFAELVAGNRGLKNTLGKVSAASDQTAVVAAVLELLYSWLPIPKLNVSGVLSPPTDHAATTLSLENGSRAEASVYLEGPLLTPGTTPKAKDYLDLVEPAAVWVQYEVARVLRGGKGEAGQAESYALWWEAREHQQAGRFFAARDIYERAVMLYPKNWAARVNLAVTEAHLARNYRRSIDILERAQRLMEQELP